MDVHRLYALLQDIKDQKIDIDSAVETLKELPYYDMGFAKVDTHRHLRLGVPEVIFCQGKRIDQIVTIAKRLVEDNCNIMATRANKEVFEAIQAVEASALVRETLGDHIFNKFIQNKKIEWDCYRTHVSQYEIEKYLPIM